MQDFEELYSWKDEFARITLYKDAGNFTSLNIDNGLQFAEKDEHRYHQSVFMLPSLFSPVKKQKVLILGGGDGLGVRELLKLKHIESIDLVDISDAMIFMSTKHKDMTELNHDSLNNKKVTVHIEDSLDFIEKAKSKGQKWDLIVLDYPDPYVDENNPINKLFSKEHYMDVMELLSDDGVLSAQSTSVYISPNVFAKISLNMEASSSSILRLVINMQSFGDIGVIFARKREDDDKEWKLYQEIPKKAFFTANSIGRFLYFLEDEKPCLSMEHINEMDISTLLRYDFRADGRRNRNNFFINESVKSYSRLMNIRKEDSIDIFEKNKDIKYKTVKEIFVHNKLLLGYPNNDFETMEENDSFFNNFDVYRNKNGEIDGILSFREEDNFVENEYIYYKNLRNIKPMFRAYASILKKTNYKPISITYWEHNFLTEKILTKLGAEQTEDGFTWNIVIDGTDQNNRPKEVIDIDFGTNGQFVYNGLLGCWETDWVESKHIIEEVVRLCRDNNIGNLSIFSKTPPAEYEYYRYKVAELNYFKNMKYKKLMDYFID